MMVLFVLIFFVVLFLFLLCFFRFYLSNLFLECIFSVFSIVLCARLKMLMILKSSPCCFIASKLYHTLSFTRSTRSHTHHTPCRIQLCFVVFCGCACVYGVMSVYSCLRECIYLTWLFDLFQKNRMKMKC